MNKKNLTKHQIIKEALHKYDIDDISIDKALKLFNAFIFTLSDNLVKGRTVELRRFGTFSFRKTKHRTAYNFRTKQNIIIPSHGKIVFRPGKELKKVVK